MSKLISVSEAQRRMLDSFELLETEWTSINEAVGRVLADPVRSEMELPPFTNSSMDGFAVRSKDTSTASEVEPITLRVVADYPAGEVPDLVVGSGQAVRIMTGAPLPDSTDAVVPVEDTDFQKRQSGTQAPEKILVYNPVRKGQYIRPKGQDVQIGEVILSQGQRLRPQDIGVCAMLGFAKVPLHRKPKVAVLSTGDELLPVEEPLTPGKIHDSNMYTLVSLVDKYGGQPLKLGIASDREDVVEECLNTAVREKADLILSSAGVSVGAYDFVRDVVENHGHLSFWRVNMRPGKPVAFGNYQDVPFIGLPGNPVSAFVGFEVFVQPAIFKLLGLPQEDRPVQRVKLLEAIASDGRESYLRAVVTNQYGYWAARLTGHQGSGNLRSLVQANALLLVPSGVKSLPIGAEIDAWMLNQSFS